MAINRSKMWRIELGFQLFYGIIDHVFLFLDCLPLLGLTHFYIIQNSWILIAVVRAGWFYSPPPFHPLPPSPPPPFTPSPPSSTPPPTTQNLVKGRKNWVNRWARLTARIFILEEGKGALSQSIIQTLAPFRWVGGGGGGMVVDRQYNIPLNHLLVLCGSPGFSIDLIKGIGWLILCSDWNGNRSQKPFF